MVGKKIFSNRERFPVVSTGMKLTCPACSAKYSVPDERLDGRRVKVRCKRCGESFRVDPPADSGQVYARAAEHRRARDADLFAGLASAGAEPAIADAADEGLSKGAQLTGERNESSVLFSLATLAAQAPEPAPKATESSALIDIRALVAASASPADTGSRADDVANLGGAGVFAPLFAAPFAPPVTLAPVAESPKAQTGKGIVVFAGIAAVGVALLGVAALIALRAKAPVPATVPAGAQPVLADPTPGPTAASPSVSSTNGNVASEAPASPGAASTVAPSTARIALRTSEVRPASSGTAAPSVTATATVTATGTSTSPPVAAAPSPKCCPGESDMACQMRVAVGRACEAAPSGATVGAAPPFDRAAAGRALSINVASCKRADGPTGPGHLKVTFQPSGAVSAVEMEAPYAGTAVGTCIAQRFRGASVPAFAGSSLSVGKGFTVE
jgi:predicted Zn finger-like uncharacterized protein